MAQILNLKFANINCHTFGEIYQILLTANISGHVGNTNFNQLIKKYRYYIYM